MELYTQQLERWGFLVCRFNREGDLLISCAKDLSASLWRSEDGLRIGTFEGHKGTIWTCDITCESPCRACSAKLAAWSVGMCRSLTH